MRLISYLGLNEIGTFSINLVVIFSIVFITSSFQFFFIFLIQRYLRKFYPSLNKQINLKKFFFPWFWLFLSMGITKAAIYEFSLDKDVRIAFEKSLLVFAIVFGACFLTRSIRLFKLLLKERFYFNIPNNIKSRVLHTQLEFIEKIIFIVIWISAIASVLTSFDEVKKLGESLLASAGVLGVVVGFAAQKSIANLLAGFQIAFTQPIRFDDVVIVEGQWGRIEEITLTYIVICIWDLRRLIVPITYFIEKPFENWTRNSADLLGFVLIHVDYNFPIEDLRKEFERLLPLSKYWDGRVGIIHVVDSTDKTMVVRALMSSPDSSSSFELRCYIREKLISFVQKRFPESLPRSRHDICSAANIANLSSTQVSQRAY